MPTPLLYESHMHTPLCKHAKGEPEEYAEVALQRGLKGIIVTCHNPLPDGISQNVRMFSEQFDEYVAMVARAHDAYKGRVDVRLGLEADYIPELEPFLEKQLSSQPFNHVLGSVHPHLAYYKERFFSGDILEFEKKYFSHLADAAETGLFDTISHPDVVRRVFPDSWNVEPLLPAISEALDRIAATGVAMELNTSGFVKDGYPYPNLTMLQEIQKRNIPIVIGADAHSPDRVADHYEDALDLLEKMGYREIRFFLNRQPQVVSIENARNSLTAIVA